MVAVLRPDSEKESEGCCEIKCVPRRLQGDKEIIPKLETIPRIYESIDVRKESFHKKLKVDHDRTGGTLLTDS